MSEDMVLLFKNKNIKISFKLGRLFCRTFLIPKFNLKLYIKPKQNKKKSLINNKDINIRR